MRLWAWVSQGLGAIEVFILLYWKTIFRITCKGYWLSGKATIDISDIILEYSLITATVTILSLTGIRLSELSKIISTNAEMTRGPVPSWSNACLCSSRRWENSSDSTNWMAGRESGNLRQVMLWGIYESNADQCSFKLYPLPCNVFMPHLLTWK